MTDYNLPLLEAVCHRGVLCATSIRYWRGCKKLKAEDLGLSPENVSDRLIQLGHKRLVPKEALSAFSQIESRAHALVEGASFPFLGGIARFVPNARLANLNAQLEALKEDFRDATLEFVAGYGPMREEAMTEWREVAAQLPGDDERLLATIEQSFPPAGEIAKRFSFDTRLFQVAAPESLRLEVAEGIEQVEASRERRRVAEDASRRLQSDLDAFIRESVNALRQETAKLASDVLATIEGSDNGVHQRTLNRLSGFIDNFRSLNFAGDEQLENTLRKFRNDLLHRSAEEYRSNPEAMQSLTTGLSCLREHAVTMARSDGDDVVGRFGQLGGRKLSAVG